MKFSISFVIKDILFSQISVKNKAVNTMLHTFLKLGFIYLILTTSIMMLENRVGKHITIYLIFAWLITKSAWHIPL